MLKGIFLTQKGTDRDNDIFFNQSYLSLYKQAEVLEMTVMNIGAILSKDWSKDDIQKVTTYGSTPLAVGLSDKIKFKLNHLSTNTNQVQKAYQPMIKNCYSCHNDHSKGVLYDTFLKMLDLKIRSFNL